MCRNISNMLFVLFAVALILPAPLEAKSGIPDCRSNLYPSGHIYCQLSGYDNFTALNFQKCELDCGGPKVQLPKEACPSNSMHRGCSEEVADALTKWSADMRKRKDDLIEKMVH
uniref:Putative ixodes 10 kDa peptide protein n=1 Tax=Ixodes ricinus TaxID=34613 RepID=A0A0K8RCA6_IXORI